MHTQPAPALRAAAWVSFARIQLQHESELLNLKPKPQKGENQILRQARGRFDARVMAGLADDVLQGQQPRPTHQQIMDSLMARMPMTPKHPYAQLYGVGTTEAGHGPAFLQRKERISRAARKASPKNEGKAHQTSRHSGHLAKANTRISRAARKRQARRHATRGPALWTCLLYTSDAADE